MLILVDSDDGRVALVGGDAGSEIVEVWRDSDAACLGSVRRSEYQHQHCRHREQLG